MYRATLVIRWVATKSAGCLQQADKSAYSVIGAKLHTSEHRTHMESSGGTTLDNLVLVHVGKMSRTWQVMTSIWQL
jgi:hypothetical protein